MNFVTRRIQKLGQKQTYDHFLKLYVMPFMLYFIRLMVLGFNTCESGSLAAANFIVFLTLLTRIWKLRFTSFLVVDVNWEKVNIFVECASVLLPLVVFVFVTGV